MSKRRKYSTAFKQGAVEPARHPSVSCAQIARELGVGANVLTRWKRESEGAGAFSGTGRPKDAEVERSSASYLALGKNGIF